MLAGAWRFQERLGGWAAELDPSWRESRLAQHLLAFADAPAPARLRVSSAVFAHWCGPLPQPATLVDGAGALALCRREELLARLCALALALRPGVLRCCVDARARALLRRALGDSFDSLRQQAQGGRAVAANVARREPIAWACTGYRDLVRAELLPWRSVRRFVRVSLPRHWPVELRGADHLLGAACVAGGAVAAALERVFGLRGSPW
jgi:hypothetical protein